MTNSLNGRGNARRMLALGCLIGGAVLAAGCLGSAHADGDAMVRIDNFSFVPDALSVKVGTRVTWENEDDIPHSVVLTDKSFRSKPLDTHDTASFTFTKPGEVEYFCGLHPHMHGKIIVVP